MQNGTVTISVDAMGGVNAPDSVIKSIAQICIQRSDVLFLIYGDKLKIPLLLQNYHIPHDRYQFIATTKVISDDEKPTNALRDSVDTSMRSAIEAVRDSRADAFVSCGNTGAMMMISKMILGCMKNIKRPAIVGCMPTQNGRCVMLDLGANVDCTKMHLFQFALMGDCFAKVILNLPNPRIGILNVGSEDIKGRILEQQVAEMLRQEPNLNFIGYIEGGDIFSGNVDVVVTDGFVGNVALKSAEGLARLVLQLLKTSCRTKRISILGYIYKFFVKKLAMQSLSHIDPSNHNGAMLIGLNGIIVKSHGNSRTADINNALTVAIELAKRDINHQIIEELNNAKIQDHISIEKIVDKISEYLHH